MAPKKKMSEKLSGKNFCKLQQKRYDEKNRSKFELFRSVLIHSCIRAAYKSLGTDADIIVALVFRCAQCVKPEKPHEKCHSITLIIKLIKCRRVCPVCHQTILKSNLFFFNRFTSLFLALFGSRSCSSFMLNYSLIRN